MNERDDWTRSFEFGGESEFGVRPEQWQRDRVTLPTREVMLRMAKAHRSGFE